MAREVPPKITRFHLKPDTIETMVPLEQLPEPRTPARWFSRRFPELVRRYGWPILEGEWTNPGTETTRISPIQLNDTFFAAALSDPHLGHDVVFFEPEQCWYFLDLLDDLYHPTTEQKLMNLLSALLYRCAEAMPYAVDTERICLQLRQEWLLQHIVKKARSLLAADASFFAPDSLHQRAAGPETAGRAAKQFIQSSLEPRPLARLTVSQTFEAFRQYCLDNTLKPVDRREFKQLIAEVIREEFGVRLRHDVADGSGRHQQGWVGLSLKDVTGVLACQARN